MYYVKGVVNVNKQSQVKVVMGNTDDFMREVCKRKNSQEIIDFCVWYHELHKNDKEP
jgi:phosphotransferase system IIB component